MNDYRPSEPAADIVLRIEKRGQWPDVFNVKQVLVD